MPGATDLQNLSRQLADAKAEQERSSVEQYAQPRVDLWDNTESEQRFFAEMEERRLKQSDQEED
jgi:hypothetical protein